jgi:hypothetical protein
VHATVADLPSDKDYSKDTTWKGTQTALHISHPWPQPAESPSESIKQLTYSWGSTQWNWRVYGQSTWQGGLNTLNYCKYILKELNVGAMYRKCNEVSEMIQCITIGCRILVTMEYLLRHIQLARIVHQKLATQKTLLRMIHHVINMFPPMFYKAIIIDSIATIAF